jgi:hypothetical protein
MIAMTDKLDCGDYLYLTQSCLAVGHPGAGGGDDVDDMGVDSGGS